MRPHFQQLTEPIAQLVDRHDDERFDFTVTHSTFQIPTLAQLKSQATRSRRLHASATPRACGDPIRSPQYTSP